METNNLSSAQTFLMKFVFPAIWIPAFGAGAMALWLGSMHGRDGLPVPAEMKWLFLCGWIAGSAFILWFEIAAPVASIDRVTENRWVNIHPVTIHFRRATEFGDAITFMPKARPFGFWSAHPVVAELERVVAAQRGRSLSN